MDADHRQLHDVGRGALDDRVDGQALAQRAHLPVARSQLGDLPAPAGRSGVLSTSGGLVFLSGGGGLLVVDARTGKALWSVNLAQVSNATPMTYMVGGKQYIAVSGTGTIAAYMLY